MTVDNETLHPGQLAILRAVASGRAEITCSCEPDLYVDGMPCCNQWVVHALVRSGHVRAARPGRIGQRVAATLTAGGRSALSAVASRHSPVPAAKEIA